MSGQRTNSSAWTAEGWDEVALFYFLKLGFNAKTKGRNEKRRWTQTVLLPDTFYAPPCFSLSHLPCLSEGGRMSEEATLQMMNLPSGLDPFPAECVQWARARSWNLANETHPPEGPSSSYWLKAGQRRRRLAGGAQCRLLSEQVGTQSRGTQRRHRSPRGD